MCQKSIRCALAESRSYTRSTGPGLPFIILAGVLIQHVE
jgi:hypothetical protein